MLGIPGESHHCWHGWGSKDLQDSQWFMVANATSWLLHLVIHNAYISFIVVNLAGFVLFSTEMYGETARKHASQHHVTASGLIYCTDQYWSHMLSIISDIKFVLTWDNLGHCKFLAASIRDETGQFIEREAGMRWTSHECHWYDPQEPQQQWKTRLKSKTTEQH